jgi:hypothetical protein
VEYVRASKKLLLQRDASENVKKPGTLNKTEVLGF